MKARFSQTMSTLKQALFEKNYQNPSLFLFINLLIRAIVILPHWSFKIETIKKKRKKLW